MTKRILTVTGLAATTVLAAASFSPATAQASTQRSADVYLAATLSGKNEVPAPGTKVGDRNGTAFAVFRIHGGQVDYAIRWQKVAAPTAFHIHQGKAGKNGDVKIPFFAAALPGGLTAVKGTVRVQDSGLLERIRSNPSGWYANLHTGEFPGGAVRAQLRRIRPVSLESVLANGSRSTLTASADGRQEVPAPGTKVGDKNGRAAWLVWVSGTQVHFATTWKQIAAPTNGHIHRGVKGKNGPVVVEFFAAKNGLPAGVNGIAGIGRASAEVAGGIRNNPKGWYTNLHTAEFPGGAVRGQLYRGGW
ncbi:CHRD domain-containing protein [Nonomuraea jiangxiensis]|uniref:CHRD domain-containing protein n=1 Tax=Nonomuraea jiangxiensis TaxID=633440 RepID=A0A1G8TQZ6_9ACTN|nr:CHRD domain-containing protein [Nonomuraea jiangxiensis]SDJ43847.1 CHRD domain-containing protein [Nonomuraea jiangxiensis]